MTLTEFLLARIAEDETGARKAFDFHGDKNHGSRHYGAGFDYDCLECTMDAPFRPSRVLAECKAKREIVEWCGDRGRVFVGTHLGGDALQESDFVPGALKHPADSVVLRTIASVYADHPDYATI